jgi:CubicO group peptidase (beta-lactamase class C family)
MHMKKKKVVLTVFVGILVILIVGLLINIKPLFRLYQVMTLFNKDGIAYNFRNMDHIFGFKTVSKKAPAYRYAYRLQSLPESFPYQGRSIDTGDFIKETDTTGLLVIKNDVIGYEKYYLGCDENSRLISWSLSKSLVSCLFGIAMEDGLIEGLDKPVEYYVPRLKGTGYEGIPVIDVMQMSSGIKFDETYSKSDSDINRMGRVLALNTPIDGFVASLVKEGPPGKKLHYVSIDTQVLSMIIRECLKKNGRDFSDYFREKIWSKIGAESDCYWLLDNENQELAFGGLNATVRDYAKFGSLYLHHGEFNGHRIVSAEWVALSTTATKPYLLPGKNLSKADLGYGYQWWLPFNNDGDFIGLGIYGQFIYVYPKYGTVIVKTSAYANYNTDGAEKICQTIELFRELAKKM